MMCPPASGPRIWAEAYIRALEKIGVLSYDTRLQGLTKQEEKIIEGARENFEIETVQEPGEANIIRSDDDARQRTAALRGDGVQARINRVADTREAEGAGTAEGAEGRPGGAEGVAEGEDVIEGGDVLEGDDPLADILGSTPAERSSQRQRRAVVDEARVQQLADEVIDYLANRAGKTSKAHRAWKEAGDDFSRERIPESSRALLDYVVSITDRKNPRTGEYMFGWPGRVKKFEQSVKDRLDRHEKRLDDHDKRIAALEKWENAAKDSLLSLPRFQKLTDDRLNEVTKDIMGLVRAFENMEAAMENKSTVDRGRRLLRKLLRTRDAAQREFKSRENA